MNKQVDIGRRILSSIETAEGGFYRRWFPMMRLVWVAAAAGVWYLMPQWGLWPIVLAAVPWAIHAARTGKIWRRTPLDAALLVFLVTAWASLAVAYDPRGARPVFPAPIGWGKLWGLVLAALIFYALASLNTERERRWVLGLLSGLGVAVALWFVVTNDWDASSAKWAFIARMGRLLQPARVSKPGYLMNPNVAGGLVALTLPMSLELAAGPTQHAGERKSPWRVWGLASAAFMGLALLLSSSRGAWAGFIGALSLVAAWWLAGRISRGARRVAVFLGLVTAGGLALATILPLRALIVESETAVNRLRIFSQSMLLVRDYVFTGCGLGQFPAVHSTYALMIYVPVLIYAHATPVAVAVEQGLPAALTLVGAWGGGAWMGLRALAHSDPAPTGLAAGLLALTVMVIHGAFDNVIYGTRALLLLWVPVGLIVAASRGATQRRKEIEQQRASYPRWWGVAAAGVATLALGILLSRPLAARWQGNIGAAHQTLVELQAYDWQRFDDPTLDEVRRREDLSTAVAHFERALVLDPGQVTARTRLAQISLARGAYEEALTHAQAAWDVGHRDRVTRLILGDALVARGRVDEAVSIVRGLEWAEARLDGQAFYRYWVSEDWERAAYAWRAELRLDPENTRVRQAAKRAEERMSQEN